MYYELWGGHQWNIARAAFEAVDQILQSRGPFSQVAWWTFFGYTDIWLTYEEKPGKFNFFLCDS